MTQTKVVGGAVRPHGFRSLSGGVLQNSNANRTSRARVNMFLLKSSTVSLILIS